MGTKLLLLDSLLQEKSKRMSEGGTRILSEGGSRSRTCSESSDLGDATGPVKTTGISYDLDGKFSFTKIMKPGQLSQSLTGVGGSGKTFSYVTSDMRPIPPGKLNFKIWDSSVN